MNRSAMLFVILLLLVTSPLLAEIPLVIKDGDSVVTLDANMRPRYEIDGRDFNEETGLTDYGTLRTRIGINVMPAENVLIRVEFKESRLLGTQYPNAMPTTWMHAQEAYFRVGNLLDLPVALKAGRFEIKYGRNRIMGPGNWNVYGPRSYDGAMLCVKTDYGKWDLGALKIVDYQYSETLNTFYDDFYPNSRADFNLFLLAGHFFENTVQPLFYAEVDNHGEEVMGENEEMQTEYLHRYTAAIYVGRKYNGFKFAFDGAYQFGDDYGRDIAAYLLAADVGYMFDAAWKPYLGVGFDMTSGQGDDDSEVNVFYAPYMSRHVYRGYMDYFADVPLGLQDMIVRLGVEPVEDWKLMLHFHNFSYVEDAINADGDSYTGLGQEIDLRTMFPIHEYVTIDAGYSIFMASDDWRPVTNDMAKWAYISAIAKF